MRGWAFWTRPGCRKKERGFSRELVAGPSGEADVCRGGKGRFGREVVAGPSGDAGVCEGARAGSVRRVRLCVVGEARSSPERRKCVRPGGSG